MEDIQQLAIPLKQSQIDAANEFWKGGWESKEFEQLRMAFPNSLDAVRIKAIVLNALYGTNIIAIAQAADRVGIESKSTDRLGLGRTTGQ
jgi:hypothetical protein